MLIYQYHIVTVSIAIHR